MRLVGWNVNSIRAHETRVLRWVEGHRPDVIALQEIMCDDRSFPRRGFAELGYQASFTVNRAEAAWHCCRAFQ